MQKIFVGDVHGCAEEFDELLDRARNEFSDDFELYCVGDLVNRGPQSLRVLETVRELEARGRGTAVLGNHDLALIAVWLGIREVGPLDTFGDVLESAEADDWLDWLRSRPLAVMGRLEDGGAFAMVHAAVDPDWELSELEACSRRAGARLAAASRDEVASFLSEPAVSSADLDVVGRLTSCRSIRDDGSWSSDKPDRPRDAWHRRWRENGHDYGIVFGHWAAQGLYVAPDLRGLDTGCVHHGRGRDGLLTAWLPASGGRAKGPGFSPHDTTFWQIPARRAYYAGVRAAAKRFEIA